MKYLRLTALLITALVTTLNYGQQKISNGNFRIFPSNVTQTEPVVAVSPANPNFLFVSAVTINTTNFFRSEGVYCSTNGGSEWFGSDTMKGALLENHGGSPNVVIDKNGVLIQTHRGATFPGIYSHRSTDTLKTWSASVRLTTNNNDVPEDKGTMTYDKDPLSPYSGRLYASWVNYTSPYPVLVSYSTNSGQSWTAPKAVNGVPPANCSGGNIKTGSNGKVYIAWAGVINSTPFSENFIGFGSSTNGGVDWSVNQNIYDVNGINGTLQTKGGIRVNGLPKMEIDKSGGIRNNWIYILTTEKGLAPAGSDPDIILHRSTDDGITWSGGIRVNQDPLNNGKIQYFPAINIDSEGGLNILFYDDRNTTPDSTEVFLARSTDGGNTFTEYILSDARFKPKPISGGASQYQGDHISLTSIGNKLHAFWMADYTGKYQVWSTIMDIPSDINETQPEIITGFTLLNNYPNPFNPSTKVDFVLPAYTKVSADVYNVHGEKVASILNGKEFNPGKHTLDINLNGYSSGVYFLKLSAAGTVKTTKLVLMK